MADELPSAFMNVRMDYPEIASAYEALAAAAQQAGPLSEKERQLVKLALAVGAGLEGATHSHTRRGLEQGIDAAALKQVALLAITTLGFPSAVRGLTWVRDVTDAE
ncbi:MAG: carboxymuconolactone decarboxylase family protein [Anaerolineae bacterium]|nr:carboxymuconolactone decarboxylase family protein [Anaerolineae bacterium]